MNFLSLIESKREGRRLAPEQIQDFIREFTAGNIPEYQMAALLMAIYFRGLDTRETTALTLAMRDSGVQLEFPKDPRPLVDKHSTGGVGDKVSLPLVPLLACLGFRVPMIAGRSLGITGGTLDKLDSIPGFQTLLPAEKIIAQVQKIGCAICGQTNRMVPADQKLYALRDATGTVPSLPLITASILSKKLAENLDALILDVKFGRAAFMPTKAAAHKLARAMVALGNKCGVNTCAVLTDMNTPLGRAAGNWLEVKESVAILEPHPAGLRSTKSQIERKGGGAVERVPADLRSLVLDCAAHLLVQTRKARTLPAALKVAENCLSSGAPRKKWNEMIVAQGADLSAFNRKLAREVTVPVVVEMPSGKAGFVSRCDARIVGEVVRDLGGGRWTKESVINHEVGVDHLAQPGERVKKDSVLARIHAADRTGAAAACDRLARAFLVTNQRSAPISRVLEILSPPK